MMQITMPSNALYGVVVSSPTAEVTVGPGFDVPNFSAVAPFSSGNINVVDIAVETLDVWTSGCGPYIRAPGISVTMIDLLQLDVIGIYPIWLTCRGMQYSAR
jgi:hypothetical protein